jgi:hypothetical protein
VARERSAVTKDVGLPSGQPLGDISKAIIRKGLYGTGKYPNRRRSQYDVSQTGKQDRRGVILT